MVIVFPYTLELAVYKGFFPMASAVILSELQVGFIICLDYWETVIEQLLLIIK